MPRDLRAVGVGPDQTAAPSSRTGRQLWYGGREPPPLSNYDLLDDIAAVLTGKMIQELQE